MIRLAGGPSSVDIVDAARNRRKADGNNRRPTLKARTKNRRCNRTNISRSAIASQTKRLDLWRRTASNDTAVSAIGTTTTMNSLIKPEAEEPSSMP